MIMLAALLFALLFISCGEHDLEPSNTAQVTFFNESSYSIGIHESHFDGPLLIDKLLPGNSFSVNLRPSDNYGSGSVFSVKYWRLVASGAELSSGDVWAGGIDPNMQISQNIEAGRSYIIQIPNPSKLELQETFIKILNASGKDFSLNYLSMVYYQAGEGNKELPVPKGKVGVYKFDSKNGDVEIKGYTLRQGIEEYYPFPDFTAKNGYVYSFEFNGSSVEKTGEQNLIF
jgi:hypothetical protein